MLFVVGVAVELLLLLVVFPFGVRLLRLEVVAEEDGEARDEDEAEDELCLVLE